MQLCVRWLAPTTALNLRTPTLVGAGSRQTERESALSYARRFSKK